MNIDNTLPTTNAISNTGMTIGKVRDRELPVVMTDLEMQIISLEQNIEELFQKLLPLTQDTPKVKVEEEATERIVLAPIPKTISVQVQKIRCLSAGVRRMSNLLEI